MNGKPSDSHDSATVRALKEIDADLAGLFVLGRRLCGEPDKPGLAYLIAHAGRELTNCLMRELATTGRASELPDNDDEELRARIGNALGLSPNHDTVRRWFKVHQTFARAAHARIPAPKLAPLCPAFAELAELIYGLVGGYFETQTEIDALAATEDPTSVSAERLRSLLLRPVQRRRFFSRLDKPEWLEPLRSAGFFRYPPSRITFDDGSWRGRDWPEGAYLVRMAAHEPALVAAILAAVPDDNDNFAVWRTIADAVSTLEPEHAVTLTRKVARAMRLDFAPLFAHSVIDAATALAKAKRIEAFDIVEALLWPNQLPDLPDRTHGDARPCETKYLEMLREKARSLAWSDKWVFGRINDYEFEGILRKLLPLLDLVDSDRVLDLLINRLDRVTKLAARTNARFAAAIQETKKSIDQGDEPDWDYFDAEGDIESRRWCRSLSHADEMADIRQHLAVATWKRVQARTAVGVPPSTLISRLELRENEIFRRMVLLIMAETPAIDAELQQRLDDFITSEEAISPKFGAVEVGALLRAHFPQASPPAQQAFVAAIEAGPSETYFDETGTSEERRESLEHWQRARLRWFHDRIPVALLPLAKRLGVELKKPTSQQQALDETGSWFGGVRSVAHKAPANALELLALSPADMVRFLRDWRPGDQPGDPFDAPSLEGLRTEVTNIAAESPQILGRLVPQVVGGTLPLEYLTALLHGLRSAIQQNKKVSTRVLLALADHTWKRAEEAPSATKSESQTARWAAEAVCEVLREYVEHARPNSVTRSKLWTRFATWIDCPIVWRMDPDDAIDLPTTYTRASHVAHAALSARMCEAIMELAWVEMLGEHRRTKWPPPGETSASKLVTPILDRILARSGPAAYAAHGVFGRHLNQLMWLARSWTTAQLPRLLDCGSESPGAQPAWALYIESSNVSPVIFPYCRAWYARHASWLPTDGSAPEQDPDWSLAEPFALHVVWACINGACRPGDADSLIENTFSRVPVDARNRAYWSLWRSFTDAKRLRPELRRNLLAFWESRVTALESAPATESRAAEVDGLCQLIGTPHLAVRDVIRLGQRTTALLGSKKRVTGMVWDRLEKLAEKDAKGTLVIVERLVNATLGSDYAYLTIDDVAPPLRSAIRAGGKTRETALALVNRIGNAGFTEFEVLWSEAEARA